MICIAVIGCGQWGPHHVRTFNSLLGSEVVAVADIDGARLNHIQQIYPAIKYVSTDYHKVLSDETVDAVVVSTPASTHYKLTRQALLAGKHVLCEKPLCETSEQVVELMTLSQTQGLILMVGYVFLSNMGIIKVKEMIEEEKLGDLYYLSAIRTNLGPIRNDVNAAYDLATHDISIFNWLLDAEPECVSATGASFLQSDLEDVVCISLKYPNNVLALVQASWLNPKKIRQITVVGSKKMLTWNDLELSNPVAVYDKGANAIPDLLDYGEFLRLSMWDGDVYLPKVSIEEPLKVQDRYFLECIQRGTIERSDARFSLGVVKALEAVIESLRNGGSPIPVRR